MSKKRLKGIEKSLDYLDEKISYLQKSLDSIVTYLSEQSNDIAQIEKNVEKIKLFVGLLPEVPKPDVELTETPDYPYKDSYERWESSDSDGRTIGLYMRDSENKEFIKQEQKENNETV